MTQQPEKNPMSLKAKLVIGLIKLLAKLPLTLSRWFLRPLVWLQWLLPNSTYRVSKQNLQYCFPAKTDSDLKKICRGVIKHNMNLIAETSHVWLHDYATSSQMIKEIRGHEALADAFEGDRGILLYSPHLGNWELTYAYLANQFDSAGIYKPPNIPELESVMLQGRSGSDRMFRTKASDIRKMLKELKQGGSLFLLPDQQPPEGSGVFAPFFDKPAYTMTLIQGLLHRTACDFWMCYSTFEAGQYVIHTKRIDIDASLPAEDFAKKINETLETVILDAPEQYQWGYKRFKRTPDGSPPIYRRKE